MCLRCTPNRVALPTIEPIPTPLYLKSTPIYLKAIGVLETLYRVCTHVTLECAARCSTIPTPIHLTAVGTLSRVGTHVALECAALCSTIPTPILLTPEGMLSRVG